MAQLCAWNTPAKKERHGKAPGDGYDSVHKTIYWVPNDALRWFSGFTWKYRTPALMLMHELGHAYHHEKEPERFLKDLTKFDPPTKWTSPEEMRTIQEIENVVAGQLTKPEPARHFHALIIKRNDTKSGTYFSRGSTITIEAIGSFAIP